MQPTGRFTKSKQYTIIKINPNFHLISLQEKLQFFN